MASFQSVPALLLHRINSTPSRAAFQFPKGNGWSSLTWGEFGAQVRQISSGLKALGLQPEERCAIVCSTRIEWILSDLGILCAGGATTTVYPSNTAEEFAYIIGDSDARFVFAENDEHVKKLQSQRASLPNVKFVIVVDGEGSQDGWVIPWSTLIERGTAHDTAHPKAWEEDIQKIGVKSLATLIYTSGTTGKPKGVELLQESWLYEAQGIDGLNVIHIDDIQYLWLPLSHVFGKVLVSAQIRIGFCTAVDGRVDRMIENLAVIRPTFVCAVPRIFEKVYNRIIGQVREAGGLKEKIFDWAFKVGREASALRLEGREPQGLLAVQTALAHKLVFSKIHNRFGGRLRFFISGAAPLAKDIAHFFSAANITILEGYGLTETSAASFVNRPGILKIGTVGPPLEGTQVRIAPEDGEILIKGPGVMRGYRNMPEATKESFTADGFLKTGDIGELDSVGRLRITDRKKDLIKTSNGKYIAPQSLEGRFKALCPLASQIVVHGDNRPFCTALITLDEESIKKWGKENGLGDLSYAQLAGHERVHALVKTYVDQLNSGLANHETIKKFALLPADLSEATGEMTASLKVKRKVVEQKYKKVLDGFYSASGSAAA